MITRPGGYCPMCDTVYDRPHECVGMIKKQCRCHLNDNSCEVAHGVNKQMIKASQDEMDKAVKTYRIVNVDKALETNVYERTIWNEAIEAAALRMEQSFQAKYMAEQIRKLKK